MEQRRQKKAARRVLGVRLHADAFDALMEESRLTGRSVSETVRVITNRYLYEGEAQEPLLEKLTHVLTALRELGKDIETVTRLFLVTSKVVDDEDAKAWCRQNLRAGR